MRPRRSTSHEGARKQADRERAAGLDPEDEAGQWLAEHDPAPTPERPKSTGKSKSLHRFRQSQAKKR